MKKSNLYLVLFLLVFISCGKEPSSQYHSGLALADSSNQDAVVTLNYRINQDAINAHSSLLFLNQLEMWDGTRVPESFGLTSVPELKQLFSFLHKKDNPLGIDSITVQSQRGEHLLVFKSSNRTFQLWSDRSVSRIVFDNGADAAIEMVQTAPLEWKIKNTFGVFLWSPERKTICSSVECINL